MTTASEEFVESLARMDARIAGLLAEHRHDNFGETLPHVFMGDVTRFAGELARNGGSDHGVLTSVLAAIEDAVTSGIPELQELAIASFLENFHQIDDVYGQVAQLLGPESRHALDVIERER